jgi:hypothetical protein
LSRCGSSIQFILQRGLPTRTIVDSGAFLLLHHLHRLWSGVSLCIAITILATLLEAIEVEFAGYPYIEALVIAILIGVAIRTILKPDPELIPGIAFSAKFVLECAIVMLGALVSVATVFSLGLELILGIALIVSVTIGASYMICRLLGLTQRLSILIACGNSICGNSAIAAIAPVIGADSDEIASSISFTAVLGVLVVLGLPLLVPILHLSLTQYGVLAAYRLCRAAGRRRHSTGRGAEQPSRNADQACPGFDAWAGRVLFFDFLERVTVRREEAQLRAAAAQHGAMVHRRFLIFDADPFVGFNSSSSAAGGFLHGHVHDDHRHGRTWLGC